MKKLALTLCLTALAVGVFAQGTVKFANSTSTKVTLGGSDISGAGSYYFGLVIADPGTTDLTKFTFAGVYGTNGTAAGRFAGGLSTGVIAQGWGGGVSKAYAILGWSANLGHDFNAAWLTYPNYKTDQAGRFLGVSAIASGAAGGTDALGNPLPALSLFGSTGISAGFVLTEVPVIPEPGSLALAGLGAAALLIFRRRK